MTPGFRWFFAGRAISFLGSAASPIALSFAVLQLTGGNARAMAYVLAAQTLPLIIFTLFGGILGDRVSRSRLLIVTHLFDALVLFAITAVLVFAPQAIVALVALSFIAGSLAAATRPALTGIVPQLVAPEDLQRANSALAMTKSLTRVIGPPLGGLIVTLVGGQWAVALNGLAMLIATACLTRIRVDDAPVRGSSSVLADLRSGFAEFTSRRWVWTITAAFSLMNFGYGAIILVIGPVLANDTFGAQGWGLVLGASAAGILLASSALYWLPVRRLLAAGMVAAAFIATPMIGLGLSAPLWVLIALGFVSGLGTGIVGVAWETSLQRHVPGPVIARVSSYDVVGSFIAMPIAMLVSVPIAEAIGARPFALAAGIATVVLMLAPLAVREVRELD